MEQIIYDVDVLVAGGGPAGVAAAVGAARRGKDTLLVEKNGYCGGMGTINGAFCGYYTSAKEGPLTQLVHGFAGEFYDEMKQRGGIAEPYPFGDTYIVTNDHLVWRETADHLLEQSGARVLFHTMITDIIKKDGSIAEAVGQNKSGRFIIRAKRFIDATGDGDLCAGAGVPFTYGRDGVIQYATMMFRLSGVDVEKACSHSASQLEQWMEKAEEEGYRLPRKHIYVLPSPRPGEIVCNMTAVVKADGSLIDAVNAQDMTEGEILGRRQVREYERFLRNYVPGFETCVLTDVGNELGIRQSRTIRCLKTLTNEDVMNAVKCVHPVAKSAWCIEAHGKDGIFMYYFDNEYYEIPYESMIPVNVKHLITCGRAISAEHEALASARVTAQCFLTGYAAGCASSLSIDRDEDYEQLDFEDLRQLIDY